MEEDKMGGTRFTHWKERNSYCVLVEKLERERPLGILWCRWRDRRMGLILFL
jgi:hypothetical protein